MLNKVLFLDKSASSFRQFDLQWMERSKNTLIGVDKKMRIVMLNPGYFQFAMENDGDLIARDFNLGVNILDAISGPQKDYYERLYLDCFESGKRIDQAYECSSPNTWRRLKLFIYPSEDRKALLLDHAVIAEQPNSSTISACDINEYIDKNGIIHQCGECRRIRSNDMKSWDWVPAAFRLENVTHGLCESCLAKYYPEPIEPT